MVAALCPVLLASADLGAAASRDPLEIALDFLRQRQAELNLTDADLADLVVSDRYQTKHNGLTHIYLQQRHAGIEVVNGIFNVNVTADGQVLHYGNRLVSDLAGAINTLRPTLSPEAAVERAAAELGLAPTSPLVRLEELGGPAAEVRFGGVGVSRDDIPVKLRLLPAPAGGVRLVWSLVINQINSPDWWDVLVDATTGVAAEKYNWTQQEQAGATTRGCTNNCYEVFALPKDSPLNGGRTIEDNPADPNASPFGWHDTNGVAGAEFTDTRGNNVEAQTDLDANNSFTVGTDVRPSGGASLIFTPALDLNLPPSGYRPAAVTNLFYWNNIIHDVTYQYGFDEPAGNFQTNNYGNGGTAGDPVQADAQDGSGTNNANFSTPADGVDPRMQMFVWVSPFVNVLTVLPPSPIAADYVASSAAFGPAAAGETGEVVLASDGSGVDPNDGCETIVGDLTGKIALMNRGNCTFVIKVKNAQDAGAIAAIIKKITPGNPITLGGTDATIIIPSGMITKADGDLIIANLPLNATFQPNPSPPPDRDSDLDNGVIVHEYTHGISNRLVGGPNNVSCLVDPGPASREQMGEGWSDWYALWMTAMSSDTPLLSRGIANYVAFEPLNGIGIRNFPYSISMEVNPQTYADVATTNIPHGVGEIWAAMLWDMYWTLVQRDGFDADLYSVTSHGNKKAMRLVMDGLKLTACNPTFVQARDAILAADVADFGGANQCLIWRAFAKRGLGFSASSGTNEVGDEVEAFDLPPTCFAQTAYLGPGPGGGSKLRGIQRN